MHRASEHRAGLHRNAYYKLKKQRGKQDAVTVEVVELVKEERMEHPKVGTRKLYKALNTSFEAAGLKEGRDKLIASFSTFFFSIHSHFAFDKFTIACSYTVNVLLTSCAFVPIITNTSNNNLVTNDLISF